MPLPSEYLLRYEAEQLLAELGVADPRDRRPRPAPEIEYEQHPDGTVVGHAVIHSPSGHDYDRAVSLLAAGMASERQAAS